MTSTGVTVSHGELEERSRRLSALLLHRGLVPGDRAALLLENGPTWFVGMFGVRRSAMYFVPINWHLKPAEVRYMLENSDARAIVTSAALAGTARDALENVAGVDVRLVVDGRAEGFESFEEALAATTPDWARAERDGDVMAYSSGTTGLPKGILRPLPDVGFGQRNRLESLLAELYGIDSDTIYLSPAPCYHSAPIGFNASTLLSGGTVVAMPSFDAEAALAAIERYRVSHVQMVPTHFVRLLRLPEATRRKYDLSSLRVIVHGAAPCAREVKRAMIDWFGPILYEYYSGSERCGLAAIDSREWLERPGSVGRSRTSPIHIVSPETGEELPPGETGVICFERPAPFVYHKEAQKTRETFNAAGWGTLGDLGHLDEDGYLYISDRRSDLILTGGVNVYPREIEDVLTTHPSVADAAVVGVPNEEFGQEIRAFVELLPGASATGSELIDHCRARLAHFKAPRLVEFVEALPRQPNGKLLRRELRVK